MKSIFLILTIFLSSGVGGLPAFAASNTPSDQFRDVIRKGLENNPSLKSQAELVNASRVNLNSKRMFWTPTVSARAERVIQGGDSEGSRISADLNLVKFGSDYNALKSAQYGRDAQEMKYTLSQFATESTIASALFDFYLNRSQVKFYKRSLEMKENTLRIAQEKYRKGQYAEQDVARARLDRDQTEISYLEQEVNLSKAKDRVTLLTGQTDFANLDWPWLHLLQEGSLQKSIPSEKLEVKELKAEMDSAHHRYLSAKLNYFPSIDLTGTWANSKALASENGTWSVLLSLSVPLWDRMATYATLANTVAERESLRLRMSFKQSELELQEKSQAALVDKSRERARRAMESVKSVQGLFDDSLRRFQYGKSTLSDLFVDESRFLQAELALQSALSAFHSQMIDSCHLANESILNCY